MQPNLHLGFLTIHTFGLMMWLAAVAAAFVMDRSFRRAHITVKDQGADAMSMVAIALVAGIVGAKLWHIIDTPMEFRYMGWSVLWDTAGFAWFGGLVFGISALLFQGWWAKIGALRTLDLAAPAAAIGYGIGRIGCFLSGDGCYGIAIQPVHLLSFTFTPWGMAFPHGIEPVFVPVYPTPLYELAAGLLIGGWLWWRAGSPLPGRVSSPQPQNPLGTVERPTGQRRLGPCGHPADCLGRHPPCALSESGLTTGQSVIRQSRTFAGTRNYKQRGLH
jgi:phosphatidylglycerol:prolipoprotein diacylglycerol transferase